VSRDHIKDEIDILYMASNKLTQASTRDEQLEAVSDYARDQGASFGALFYIDNDQQGQPEWLEVVAEWVTERGVSMGLDLCFYMPSFAFNRVWQATPSQPTLIEDGLASDLIDASSRANYIRWNMRGVAMLPLNIKERWVGLLMFTWTEPHVFTERDQRVFTALIQQAAPVIDSVRLFEQTKLRAGELEKAKNEIDILYAASNKLTQASTPPEWLDAVSDYARKRGATSGVLFYAEPQSRDEPEWLEMVAEWTDEEQSFVPPFTRFSVRESDRFTRIWISKPNRPTMIPDVPERLLKDPIARTLYERYRMRDAVVLPLHNQGRWVGLLMFAWREPCNFDEHDQRILTAILQQATPVIDSVRLLGETRERAARAELLLKVNTALSQAADEDEILSAVAVYAQRHEPQALSLIYFDANEAGEPVETRIASLWSEGAFQPVDPVGADDFRLMEIPATMVWMTQPKTPFLLNDCLGTEWLGEHDLALMQAQGCRAMAVLPLHSGNRWQGAITLQWAEPREFTTEEETVYSALLQSLAAVVMTRRAYLAEEEARRETELLYKTGEAINAATTFGEIVQALEHIDNGTHGIVLTIWENYDYDSATYFEVVATMNSHEAIGKRYRVSDYPIAPKMRRGLTVIENMLNDPRVDPISAASWTEQGTFARLGVPLTLGNRWMGSLAFHSHKPRSYSALEKRLVGGIGDLVTAALDRLRLQGETEASRQRAEVLARVNSALSQARDEQDILAAIAALVERYGVDYSHLAYVREVDDENVPSLMEIVAIRSGDGQALGLDEFLATNHGMMNYPLFSLAFTEPDGLFCVEDLRTDPRYEMGDLDVEDRDLPWQATIAIPLKTGDEWQGVLTFLWTTPTTFTQEMRQLFHEIRPNATSVVTRRLTYLAEQKARQETELRARELETVAKVSAAATTQLNVHDLLSTVSELTKSSFNLHRVHVYLLDEAGEALVLVASPDNAAQSFVAQHHKVRLDDESSLIAGAALTRRGVILRGDTEFTPSRTLYHQSRSEMAVPMIVADRLIGVLHVKSNEANRFSEANVQVMGTLTDLIAVAVENARLYEKAQEFAVLEERNRLARELHDSVSQALFGIGLGARTARTLLDRDPSKLAEPLDYVLSLAEAGLTEMRALIFQLRPESLENDGLVTALEKQTASVQARHGIQVESALCDEPQIPLASKEALYLIAREALHNIVKHSKAQHVIVSLECTAEACLLDIHDDGVGFDTRDSFPGHLGLRSMSERATRLHGTFDVESVPGTGTHISVCIPHGKG
jgi:signal transduction histidine kinase